MLEATIKNPTEPASNPAFDKSSSEAQSHKCPEILASFPGPHPVFCCLLYILRLAARWVGAGEPADKDTPVFGKPI